MHGANQRVTWMLVGVALLAGWGAFAQGTRDVPPLGAAGADRTMWHVDQAFYVVNDTNQWRGATGTPDAVLNFTFAGCPAWPQFNFATSASPIVSASGHITDREREDAVLCQYYGNYGAISVGLFTDQMQTGLLGSVMPANCPEAALGNRSLDVCVWDLDGRIDADAGLYHDEIVVAYNHQGTATVSVLNWKLAETARMALAPAHVSGDIAVDVGDFDGDGVKEIAVAYVQDDGTLRMAVAILRYAVSDAGAATLALAATVPNAYTFTPCTPQFCRFDIAAGPFRGKASDELGFSASRPAFFESNTTNAMNGGMALGFLTFDSTLKVVQAPVRLPQRRKEEALFEGFAAMGISATKGHFKFDPLHGYPLSRCQMAVAGSGYLYFRLFGSCIFSDVYVLEVELSEDGSQVILQTRPDYGGVVLHPDHEYNQTTDTPNYAALTRHNAVQLKAGNFTGAAGTSPVDQLLLMSELRNYTNNAAGDRTPHLLCLSFADDFTPKSTYKAPLPDAVNKPAAATAVDFQGQSLYLGTPVRITFQNIPSLDYVIAEPPKHIDMLPDDPSRPDGRWSVHNASYLSEFNVEVEDAGGVTFTTTARDKASSSFGSSTEKTAEETIGGEFGEIFKFELSHETSEKTSDTTESAETRESSSFEERKFNWVHQTNQGDFLRGRLQLVDVWRYPVYGLSDSAGRQGYLDFSVPGATSPISGGDKDFADWYQPVHENGNILSYETLAAMEFGPSDLGPFTLPDGTVVKNIMNDGGVQTWNGNADIWKLEWSKEAGKSQEKEYTHKLSDDKDTKSSIGASLTWKLGLSAKLSLNTSFSTENSWGNVQTSEVKNSSSQGIQIAVPAGGDGNWAYQFKPMAYISKTGAFKVTHAVDWDGSTQGLNWGKQYGRSWDLALNLPCRFVYQKEAGEIVWRAETRPDYRERMRGLWLRNPVPNPVTGVRNVLAPSLKAGTQVEVVTRVYNYSVLQDAVGDYVRTGSFKVKFEYVEINPSNLDEVSDRRPVGEGTVQCDGLKSLEMREVSILWPIDASLGGDLPGKSRCYRIYVTVDPDDEVPGEIHELDASYNDGETGQKVPLGNNVGYWPWKASLKIFNASLPKAGAEEEYVPADVHATPASLAIETVNGMRLNSANVLMGQSYRVRTAIHADVAAPDGVHVLFYEADPHKAAGTDTPRVIGSNVISAMDAEANYAWTDWTPAAPGTYDLYAEAVEGPEDARPGNAADTLRVTVVEPPSHTINVLVDGDGATLPQTGTHRYHEGTVVNIEAIPGEGQRLLRWEVNGRHRDAQRSLVLNAGQDMDVKAVFVNDPLAAFTGCRGALKGVEGASETRTAGDPGSAAVLAAAMLLLGGMRGKRRR